MPSSIDLWNSRFPDMFDITQPAERYDYLDGKPAAQMIGIQGRDYGPDFKYGEPPQMQRRAEQLGTVKSNPLPPGVDYAPKTKEEYEKIPPGGVYLDTDGEVYEKGAALI